jgi:hypothetical protein
MKKRKNARAKARSSSSRKSKLGFSGWAIIFLSIAIITFLGSILMNQKSAKRLNTEFSTVTLQILNGCGKNGASESLSRALMPGTGSVVYDIIEKGNAELKSFDKTIVVDRRGAANGGPSEQARVVASHLGIKNDEIIIQRFDDNILEIDVTIIAGADFEQFVESLNKSKEDTF